MHFKKSKKITKKPKQQSDWKNKHTTFLKYIKNLLFCATTKSIFR